MKQLIKTVKFSVITIILFSEHKVCYWIDVTRRKQTKHLTFARPPLSLSLRETALESFLLHYFHLLSHPPPTLHQATVVIAFRATMAVCVCLRACDCTS